MPLAALSTTLARHLASALALLALAVLVLHGAAHAATTRDGVERPLTLALHTQVHASPGHDCAGDAPGKHQGTVPHTCCDTCAGVLSTPLAGEAVPPPVACFDAPAPVASPTGLDPGGLRRPPRRAVIA